MSDKTLRGVAAALGGLAGAAVLALQDTSTVSALPSARSATTPGCSTTPSGLNLLSPPVWVDQDNNDDEVRSSDGGGERTPSDPGRLPRDVGAALGEFSLLEAQLGEFGPAVFSDAAAFALPVPASSAAAAPRAAGSNRADRLAPLPTGRLTRGKPATLRIYVSLDHWLTYRCRANLTTQGKYGWRPLPRFWITLR